MGSVNGMPRFSDRIRLPANRKTPKKDIYLIIKKRENT